MTIRNEDARKLANSIDRLKIRQAEVNDCAIFNPDLHDVSMIGGRWSLVLKPKRTVDNQMREKSDRVIRTLVDLQEAWDRRNKEQIDGEE